MSDQSPNLGNTLYTGGLLGGVLTINGDNTPAQIIGGTAPITVGNFGGGVHAIGITAYTNLLDGFVPRTGGAGATDYLAADGTWKASTSGTVTNVTGTAPIASTGGATPAISVAVFGVATSGVVPLTGAAGATDYIAADGTWKPVPGGVASVTGTAPIASTGGANPAISVAAFGVATSGVVPLTGVAPATNYLAVDGTWKTIPTSGVTSINADSTAAQLITALANSGVSIVNGGGGSHTIAGPTSIGSFNTGGIVALPNGVLTTIVTTVFVTTGIYCVTWDATIDGVAAQIADFVPKHNAALVHDCSGLVEVAGQTLGQSGAFVLAITAGDSVHLAINHHGGGAATNSVKSSIRAFMIAT